MDPFSLALGVLTVVQTSAEAVNKLYSFIQTIQHAPDEIKSLSKEAHGLYSALRRISEALTDPKVRLYVSKHPDVEEDLASLKDPLTLCLERVGTVMVALEKVTDRDGKGNRTVKKFRWPLEKGGVVAARNELAQARSNATFAFAGLSFVDNLRKKADQEALDAQRREDPSRSPSRSRVEDLQRRDEDFRQAARDNNVEILRLLLDEGTPVDAKDADGRTALSFAAEHGNLEATALLIERKAYVNVASNEILEGPWFKRHEGTRTALHWAAIGGHYLVAEQLLKAGANIEAATKGQWTAVMVAATAGHKHTMIALLDCGAKVNARTYRGWSMLHIVASSGRVDIAQLLLERGADVEAEYTGRAPGVNDATNRRPLHIAVRPMQKPSSNETAMIDVLLRNGRAKVSAQDSNGSTPIHYAVDSKWKAAVRVLVQYATVADLAMKNHENETALDIATRSGDAEMTELIKYGTKGSRSASKSPNMRLEETFP